MAKEPVRRTISIITPCFNEQENIGPCHEAIKALFDGPLKAYDHEHVFCDNASTDDTANTLRALAASDDRVKVILNARNFGPFRSTFNGLLASSGDAVVVLFAADLQDPVEIIADFVEKWEQGFEVVHGVRATREEGKIMQFVRRAYYRTVNRFADYHIPPDVGEFQLVDKCVVEELRKVDDYYPYIRGIIASCGFRTASVSFEWKKRARGLSKNRLHHLIDQGLNGLISSSTVPLRLFMILGAAIALLSVLYAVVSLLVSLILYRELTAPGIPGLIASLFFLSGIQLFLIGVIGEYVGAIHAQVRKRPMVVERERINF